MRRRTGGTTRTALIRWWKTWRTCCQTSLPLRRKSYHHLVHMHSLFLTHTCIFLYSALTNLQFALSSLLSTCHLRCCNWEGHQVSQNEARYSKKRRQSTKRCVTGCPKPQSFSDQSPRTKKRASWTWKRKRWGPRVRQWELGLPS